MATCSHAGRDTARCGGTAISSLVAGGRTLRACGWHSTALRRLHLGLVAWGQESVLEPASLAVVVTRCAHCEHPAHAPGGCEKPFDEPYALYGMCDCGGPLEPHDHLPDLRELVPLDTNVASWVAATTGSYSTTCAIDECAEPLVVTLHRRESLQYVGPPVDGDWATEAEMAEGAAEAADHTAALNRGYARDRI